MAAPKVIFSDFDGTLTHHLELRPNIFSVIQECKRLGAPLIVCTGRSVSWGHFLLTHLPMTHAILEGGGMVLETKNHFDIREIPMATPQELSRLAEVTSLLLGKFPGLKLSVDSFGRRADRAIENFASDAQKKSIEEFLASEKVNFSTSNVHLNYWVGDFNKYKTIKWVLKNYYPGIKEDEVLFFGDSLNDQSVFESLPHTVGVANIQNVLGRLKHLPSVVLKGQENESADGVLGYLRSLK